MFLSQFTSHCVKHTRIRVLSGPHIPVSRVNKGICILIARMIHIGMVPMPVGMNMYIGMVPLFSLNMKIRGSDKTRILVYFTQFQRNHKLKYHLIF